MASISLPHYDPNCNVSGYQTQIKQPLSGTAKQPFLFENTKVFSPSGEQQAAFGISGKKTSSSNTQNTPNETSGVSPFKDPSGFSSHLKARGCVKNHSPHVSINIKNQEILLKTPIFSHENLLAKRRFGF